MVQTKRIAALGDKNCKGYQKANLLYPWGPRRLKITFCHWTVFHLFDTQMVKMHKMEKMVLQLLERRRKRRRRSQQELNQEMDKVCLFVCFVIYYHFTVPWSTRVWKGTGKLLGEPNKMLQGMQKGLNQVQALTGVIVFCSLSAQDYTWVPANLLLRVNPVMNYHLIWGEVGIV